MFCAHEPLIFPGTFAEYAANPQLYVPFSFGLNNVTQQAEYNEVATKFRQIYFNGLEPSQVDITKWTDFQSDSIFAFGIDRTVRYYASKSTHPIYYYLFSYDGPWNGIKNQLFLDLPGACHADVRDIFVIKRYY